ncbi:thiamine-phosphate diphosphorylase [Thiogranum longum]|uniref:Thiamine-phosphate synthase n=1 Tax=Thiogranum longum TaxID=1537524 RepID=A0A4R1HF71_9GAMM|nr:thiamine phosphate synthase [Thiogranum longum]TCK19411.1 thiamine-phosphate diphosphorylase [Thiogranum longum]
MLRGLYVITDAGLQTPARLVPGVRQAIEGGAVLVQYRDKSNDPARREQQASELVELCNAQNAKLIINDDVALAAKVGAHGVHLGRDDLTIGRAREQLGKKALIGISCYNQWPLAQQAAEAGADYVAFGRFFVSQTKPDAVQATPALLTQARRELDIPVAAIGGITADNGAALIEAGADLLAVVRDVFAATDVRAAAQRYQALFASHEHSPCDAGQHGENRA